MVLMQGAQSIDLVGRIKSNLSLAS